MLCEAVDDGIVTQQIMDKFAITQPDGQVVAGRDDLRVGGLGQRAWTRPGRTLRTRVQSAIASARRWQGTRS